MISAWNEWHRTCALKPCTEEHRAYLVGFARERFARYLDRYAARWETDAARPLTRDAWHLFEVHARVNRTRAGKAYKDWMFAATGDNARRTVEGRATVLIRSAVRDALIAECPPAGTESLDRARVPGTDRRTVLETLTGSPDPAELLCLREYERDARRCGARCFERTTRPERLALLAGGIGLPLTSGRMVRIGRCGRTTLHDAHRRLADRVGRTVDARYPAADPHDLATVAIMVFRDLEQRVMDWARTEEELAPLVRSA